MWRRPVWRMRVGMSDTDSGRCIVILTAVLLSLPTAQNLIPTLHSRHPQLQMLNKATADDPTPTPGHMYEEICSECPCPSNMDISSSGSLAARCYRQACIWLPSAAAEFNVVSFPAATLACRCRNHVHFRGRMLGAGGLPAETAGQEVAAY